MKARIAVFLFGLFFLISCTLSSDAPRILSMSVVDGQRVADTDSFRSITITFSKPMNRLTVERNVLLSGFGGRIVFRWEDDNRTILLLLSDPLRNGERYALEIGRGCECEDGFDLGRNHRYTLYTYAVDDEFAIESTQPADGGVVGVYDGLSVEVRFSLPVEHASLLDKVTLEPEVPFRYAFSSDRRTLTLTLLEHLAPNTIYRVTLSEDFRALDGMRLGKPYSFSFNTVTNRDPLRLLRAAMVDDGAVDGGVALDVGYLGRAAGVGKNMELYVLFSSDFFLGSAKGCIAIEPPIPFTLRKEGCALRFRFERHMDPDTTYRATFYGSMKNIFGVALDREYAFEWLVNADDSRKLRPELIRLRNPYFVPEEPELFPHTEIFREGAPIHNRPLMPYYADGETRVAVEAVFSAPLDLYPSLDGRNILLEFVYGDTPAEDGTLRDVIWEELERTLTLVFSLPPVSGGSGSMGVFYKLTLRGGDRGIVDRDGNGMDSNVSIYVRYPYGP